MQEGSLIREIFRVKGSSHYMTENGGGVAPGCFGAANIIRIKDFTCIDVLERSLKVNNMMNIYQNLNTFCEKWSDFFS